MKIINMNDRVEERKIKARHNFFDRVVYHEKIKNCMSGNNEVAVMKIFDALGYKIEIDYIRQYPVGQRYVLDFAFVKEQVAIEIDGKNHLEKKQKRSDNKRDAYLRSNNWATIRINDSDLFGYKGSFYKNLMKEIIEERREQYGIGILYPIDFTKFNDEDYD